MSKSLQRPPEGFRFHLRLTKEEMNRRTATLLDYLAKNDVKSLIQDENIAGLSGVSSQHSMLMIKGDRKGGSA